MGVYVPRTTGVYGTVYDPDFEPDSEVWDNTETCIYMTRTAEGTLGGKMPVPDSVWFMIKKDMLPPSSPLLKMDLSIELPGRILEPLGIVPKSNDILQRGDGTQWRIMLVEEPANVDWRVHVVRITQAVS